MKLTIWVLVRRVLVCARSVLVRHTTARSVQSRLLFIRSLHKDEGVDRAHDCVIAVARWFKRSIFRSVKEVRGQSQRIQQKKQGMRLAAANRLGPHQG